MSTIIYGKLCCIIMLLQFIAVEPAAAVTVGGTVRQPLNLSVEQLKLIAAREVRHADLTSKKEYNGVFTFQAVPLQAILGMAQIEKDGPGFTKTTDLAIAIRSRDGKTVVLSWGEVFYRNPDNAVLAVAATPIYPHKMTSCRECHAPSFYQPALDRLKRTIPFPKLVLANDFYGDRSIEDVVAIEVLDLRKTAETKKAGASGPQRITVRDLGGNTTEITRLAGYQKLAVDLRVLGDGHGYHGLQRYEGVPLRQVLSKVAEGMDTATAVIITSRDGYRVCLSFGELFLSPLGERIIVTELPGKSAGQDSTFALVVPDDLAADRMAKSIDTIDLISVRAQPMVYVISTGSGDPRLMTLEAVSAMGKADAFIASESMARQFSHYMAGKPVLFDPMANAEPVFRKRNPDLKPKEITAKLEAQRAADMAKIRAALVAGKSIALLDHGDPTVFGGWQHWLEREIDGRFQVITGISAYNAANALFANEKLFTGISAFGKGAPDNLLCNSGSAILTAPASLAADESLLKAVAASGDTVAIFMALTELKTLVPLLQTYYGEHAPVAIAYHVGIARQERIVRTTLKELPEVAAREGERMMGMLYLGKCLR